MQKYIEAIYKSTYAKDHLQLKNTFDKNTFHFSKMTDWKNKFICKQRPSFVHANVLFEDKLDYMLWYTFQENTKTFSKYFRSGNITWTALLINTNKLSVS